MGCAATTPRFTAPGNAGRVGLFRDSRTESEKGLLNSHFRKSGVVSPINGGFTANIPGLPRRKECCKISVPKDKYKFALWLHPDTLERVKELYRQDDCRSKSEFIEKAVRFYIGCLTAEDGTSYLPNAFLSNMKSIVAESDNRQSKMLFKLAVELAMLMNVVAASNEIDEISLARLRGECVQEVKRLNGSFSFEDAVEWQS